MRAAPRGKTRVTAVVTGALLALSAPLFGGCYAVRSRWPLYLDPPPVERQCKVDSDCDTLRVDLLHRSCCPTQDYQPLNKDSGERWRDYCEHQGPSQCDWSGGPQGPAVGVGHCVLSRDYDTPVCTATTETVAGRIPEHAR